MTNFMELALLEQMANNSAKRRRIVLNQEIDRDISSKFFYWLETLEKLDDIKETKEPITIVIDSYGGQIYAGMPIIGEIERLKEKGYEIITETRGVAMSMGFCIALSGSKRVSNRYARFMSHQPSSGTWGKLQDMKEDVEETEKLWTFLKEIIMKYSNITEEMLEQSRKNKTDVFYSPQELLALGGIDEIL